jgi:hypothetical protein
MAGEIFSMFFGGGGWDRTGTSLTPSKRGYSETKWVAIGSITMHKKIPRMGFNWKMFLWWRGMGSNHRPSDYEPDELPLLYPATCPYTVWKIRQSQFSEKKSSVFLLLILFLFSLCENGANGWSRTADHRVMSPVLYRWATLAYDVNMSPVPPQADTLAYDVNMSPVPPQADTLAYDVNMSPVPPQADTLAYDVNMSPVPPQADTLAYDVNMSPVPPQADTLAYDVNMSPVPPQADTLAYDVNMSPVPPQADTLAWFTFRLIEKVKGNFYCLAII